MSRQRIEDNWSNKPENSLLAIFRSWMPQTAASIDQRKLALEKLALRYPEIGWRICIEQFTPGSRTGHYSHRPRWRNDAAGAGQVVTRGEDFQLRRKAVDIAIAWPAHDERTLGDLVERLQVMDPDDQERVWQLIEKWNSAGPTDEKKAVLRERIRRYAFTRRGRRRNLGQQTKDRAREIHELLEPADPVIYHKWLFAQQWVEESLEELEGEDFDHQKHSERIGKLRREALREIWAKSGFEGIKALCASGNAAGAIGWHLADGVIPGADVANFLHQVVTGRFGHELDARLDNCIGGFLRKLDESERQTIMSSLIDRLVCEEGDASDSVARLCRCAPFGRGTWAHVDLLPGTLRKRYWQQVQPGWAHFDDAELNHLIDELLAENRPRAAFSVAHLEWKSVETPRLIRLLREVASNGAEPPGHYQVDAHDIASAFESLEKRTDVSRDELAQLEFTFVKALEHTEHGIPNLERQLARSPQLFVQVLALTYKRDDEGQDPPEWAVREENREAAWQASFTLLENAKCIPGTREGGAIDVDELTRWISEVRRLCEQHARRVIGDHAIGKLLSACAAGADGIWPCEPVRQVLEDIASKEMASGMSIGLYNSRGASWRGEGGAEERALASKYRNWSKQLAFEYPFVATMLEDIARSYDHDAERWENDRKIRRRIRN